MATVLPAGAGHAAVGCGAVITRSARLSANLNCPGSTITVAGNGAVLDFAGYTVTGDGTAPGVRVTGAGVILQNGTLRGFTEGVTLMADEPVQPSVTVKRMIVRNNTVGVATFDAPAYILHSRIVHNETGLGGVPDFGGGGPFRVHYATLARNGVAIDLNAAGGAQVTNSSLDDNRFGVACSQSVFSVSDTKIRRNGTGVAAYQCDGSSVAKSWLIDNRVGASLTQALDGTYVLDRNSITSNGIGVELSQLATVAISNNMFRYNEIGISTAANPEDMATQPTAQGTVSSNRFHGNGNGVLADDANQLVFTGNLAYQNKAWGIYTVGGTDGGGNVAWGNGQPSQCSGVACTAP